MPSPLGCLSTPGVYTCSHKGIGPTTLGAAQQGALDEPHGLAVPGLAPQPQEEAGAGGLRGIRLDPHVLMVPTPFFRGWLRRPKGNQSLFGFHGAWGLFNRSALVPRMLFAEEEVKLKKTISYMNRAGFNDSVTADMILDEELHCLFAIR